MHGKAFMLLLAIVMNFSMPMKSNAGEIQVQTERMNIRQNRNGNTNINTENMQFSVPNRRSRFRDYFPHNYSQQSTFKGCSSGQVVRQSNQQINHSYRTRNHSSTSHYQCR